MGTKKTAIVGETRDAWDGFGLMALIPGRCTLKNENHLLECGCLRILT